MVPKLNFAFCCSTFFHVTPHLSPAPDFLQGLCCRVEEVGVKLLEKEGYIYGATVEERMDRLREGEHAGERVRERERELFMTESQVYHQKKKKNAVYLIRL